MSYLNIKKLKRNTRRAIEIASAAESEEVRIAGETVTEARDSFDAADVEVQRLEGVSLKESSESSVALDGLAKKYDVVCSTIAMKLPFEQLPGRSSSLTTGDDLIEAAETIEDLLVEAAGVDESHPIDGEGDAAPPGERWALSLLTGLSPLLSSAVKEYREATKASADLQKAKKSRDDARGELRRCLLGFRRVVRDAYGSSSKEYHRLRARNMGDANEEDTSGTPEPSPGETDTVTEEEPDSSGTTPPSDSGTPPTE